MRRMIREEVPPCPSQRVSTLAAKAHPTVSQQRAAADRQRIGALRGELDWIVMKALEKDRARRYESASAFAADVQRYLDDQSVQACPPSAWYRFRKFARRNKGALAMASLAGVAVLVLASSLAWIAIAEQGRARAIEDARRENYFHRITLAHRGNALEQLAKCPVDLRGWEWDYLMRLCKVDPLIIRDTNKTEFYGMAFSPDGERLASAGADGIVRIRDSRTGKEMKSFRAHKGRVSSVVFHRDGKHLASRGADKTVNVWDLMAPDTAVFTEPCDEISFGAYTVAFSSDGRLLAWGSEGVVKVCDWKNWKNRQPLPDLPGHNFHSIPVAFSGDGRLATASFYGEGVKVWDAQTGKPLCPIDHNVPVGALAFAPDGKWLAAASRRGPVILWDSTTGAVRQTFDLHSGNVECVAISPDGRYVASGGEDKTVRFWDAATGREILGLQGHTDKCWCVAFSPDGRRLASASSDGTIRIWDATPLKGDERLELRSLDHGDEVRTVAFSPDGLWIASGGDDGLAKVWDAQTGRLTVKFSRHKDSKGGHVPVFWLAWHPKGHLIASSSVDTVRVWDARTGLEDEDFNLVPADHRNHTVAFSPDGRYLVTGTASGAVQVCDGRTGKPVGTLDILRLSIGSLVFSRDGDLLASADRDGTVKVWDAKRLDKEYLDGKPEPRIPPIRARVPGPGVNIAFSPDGRRLATGGEKNTVIIRDVETGDKILTLWGEHSGEVYAVAFSPLDDGRLIATAGEDSSVKIWDSHTGKLIHSFRGHTGLVSSLSFSPDGRRLISGSRDKTVKIWDMTQLSEVREP
jgi:WD40 repeat protein